MSNINFSLLATILLVCGMHSAVTAAHPLSSLATPDTNSENSASLRERSSNFSNISQISTVTRGLAKRDIGIAHWILIIFIVVVVLAFVVWWKCIRPRKMAEQVLKGADDGDQSSGSSKAQKAIKIVKMFL